MKIVRASVCLGTLFVLAASVSAQTPPLSWPDETIDTWHGFKRHNFTIEGCRAWVVEPNKALPGMPWSWCMEFPDAFTERCAAPALLEKGFHHAHIAVGNTFGSPDAVKKFQAFHASLRQRGLSEKAVLIGLSRGGLYAYRFAAENPSKVSVIYGDAPVCDFKSWPGGKGKGKGSAGDWAELMKCYGFKDEAEALAYKGNPIDVLKPLADAKIALIHVVGDADDVVPADENTAIVEKRYRELGGRIEVIHKPGIGHHPHGLEDPAPIVKFIVEHSVATAQAAADAQGVPAARPARTKIPIIHSTDLFHPYSDPDDHYDLACLFGIEEFDVRGIVLDLGGTQAKQPGKPAVEQMMRIAGRRRPYAIGLSRPLGSRADRALEEPAEFQAGVELILSVLRESKEKVILHTTGSCRDVAAAFNREPQLVKDKVRAVYFNIGRGPNETQDEWNVGYDPASYLRIFESGLPIYWCPCFGKDGYETLYTVDQSAVVGACRQSVRNFFVYCLTKSTADPIAFLTSGPHPLPTGPRNMWCTAPMLHAAGRRIYQRGAGDFVALPPAGAQREGLAGQEVTAFQFVPMRATVEDVGAGPKLRVALDSSEPNGWVFRAVNPRYREIMASCLKNLLAGLPERSAEN
ncbi:MAG: nucleoside hydrolase [Pirellulales bacterium]